MPNNYLSVLYKHIIQVENKNVGLKVGAGGWGQIPPPPPPPRFLGQWLVYATKDSMFNASSHMRNINTSIKIRRPN